MLKAVQLCSDCFSVFSYCWKDWQNIQHWKLLGRILRLLSISQCWFQVCPLVWSHVLPLRARHHLAQKTKDHSSKLSDWSGTVFFSAWWPSSSIKQDQEDLVGFELLLELLVFEQLFLVLLSKLLWWFDDLKELLNQLLNQSITINSNMAQLALN